MTNEEKAVNEVFDPFNAKPDPRIKTSSGGYTKILDGQTVRLRVTTNIFRYYTVKPADSLMPMMNNDLRELLKETTIDELFENSDYEIRERYAFIAWNFETEQAEVWQVSRKLFDNLRTLHRDEEWEDGLDSNDVKVTRTGKGTETTYTVNYARKSEPLTTDQEQQILNLDVLAMVAGAKKL